MSDAASPRYPSSAAYRPTVCSAASAELRCGRGRTDAVVASVTIPLRFPARSGVSCAAGAKSVSRPAKSRQGANFWPLPRLSRVTQARNRALDADVLPASDPAGDCCQPCVPAANVGGMTGVVLRWPVGSTAVSVGVIVGVLAAPATAHADPSTAGRWVVSWAASPTMAGTFPDLACPSGSGLHDQTVRDILSTSVGGTRVRVRLANTFGGQPLRIGRATVALVEAGAAAGPGPPPGVTVGGGP